MIVRIQASSQRRAAYEEDPTSWRRRASERYHAADDVLNIYTHIEQLKTSSAIQNSNRKAKFGDLAIFFERVQQNLFFVESEYRIVIMRNIQQETEMQR